MVALETDLDVWRCHWEIILQLLWADATFDLFLFLRLVFSVVYYGTAKTELFLVFCVDVGLSEFEWVQGSRSWRRCRLLLRASWTDEAGGGWLCLGFDRAFLWWLLRSLGLFQVWLSVLVEIVACEWHCWWLLHFILFLLLNFSLFLLDLRQQIWPLRMF